MNLEIFLLGLLVISVMTGLVTEALKKILEERNIRYYANTLAGAVSVALSGAVETGYQVMTETAFSRKMAVILIALMFLSWLSAMVGYDKVIQTLAQFKTYSGGGQ